MHSLHRLPYALLLPSETIKLARLFYPETWLRQTGYFDVQPLPFTSVEAQTKAQAAGVNQGGVIFFDSRMSRERRI